MLNEYQIGALGAVNTVYGYTKEDAQEEFKKRRLEQQKELDSVYNVKEIRQNPESVNWLYLTVWKIMDETFIREFIDYLDWKLVSKYQDVSKDFRREMDVRYK